MTMPSGVIISVATGDIQNRLTRMNSSITALLSRCWIWNIQNGTVLTGGSVNRARVSAVFAWSKYEIGSVINRLVASDNNSCPMPVLTSEDMRACVSVSHDDSTVMTLKPISRARIARNRSDMSDRNGSQPPSYFINAYKNAKNNDPALLSASAIAGDVPNGCASAAAGQRYKDVVDGIGGVWSTICTTNFGPALHNIGVEAAELQSTFYLSRQPVVASIVVRVNNVVQPNPANWHYNAGPNSVTFTAGHIPNPGDAVKIEYDVYCTAP